MFAGCLRIYNKKNAELFLKLWYIQSKEIENKNKNYYEKKKRTSKKAKQDFAWVSTLQQTHGWMVWMK